MVELEVAHLSSYLMYIRNWKLHWFIGNDISWLVEITWPVKNPFMRSFPSFCKCFFGEMVLRFGPFLHVTDLSDLIILFDHLFDCFTKFCKRKTKYSNGNAAFPFFFHYKVVPRRASRQSFFSRGEFATQLKIFVVCSFFVNQV